MRSAVAFSCLLASLIAAPATASECPGNPGALGTSRTIVVDPSEHSLLGGHQYRESLPLNDKEVVITFDDGPLPPYSTRILDILAQECVKATFFMVGRMARSFPQIVRRTHDEGHTLANHSQSHPFNFHRMSVEDAAREIEGGFQSIAAAVGDPAKVAPFFRFPGLLRQDSVEHYLRSKRVMAWSVDFMADDWTRINAHEINRRALERLEAKGKGILLLHDIKPATALGLPDLLRELKARGYRVVHVVPSAAGRPATVTTADQWLVRQPPGREQVAQGEPSVWPRVLPYRVRAAATTMQAPSVTSFGAETHDDAVPVTLVSAPETLRAGDGEVAAAAVARGGHHARGVPGTRRPAGAGRGPFPLQPDHPRPRRQEGQAQAQPRDHPLDQCGYHRVDHRVGRRRPPAQGQIRQDRQIGQPVTQKRGQAAQQQPARRQRPDRPPDPDHPAAGEPGATQPLGAFSRSIRDGAADWTRTSTDFSASTSS